MDSLVSRHCLKTPRLQDESSLIYLKRTNTPHESAATWTQDRYFIVVNRGGNRLQRFPLFPTHADGVTSFGWDHRCGAGSLYQFSSGCPSGGDAFLQAGNSVSVFFEAFPCRVVMSKHFGSADRWNRHFCRDNTIDRQNRIGSWHNGVLAIKKLLRVTPHASEELSVGSLRK